MEKKYIFGLVLISFLLTNIVAYLDEGLYNFNYLSNGGDWFALIIYTIVFLVIPFLLFFGIRKKLNKRFEFSLLGFIPTIMLILIQLA